MTAELEHITIAEAARLIEAKQLSPVELAEAKLALIEGLEGQLDSFVTLMADQAIEKARAAQDEIAAGTYRGPLHGVPLGLKDIYNTAGVLTAAQSRILIDHVPDWDATTTKMLDTAGSVLMGKLTTHEFAHGGPSFDLPWPPARNPWNPEHFTGGSSSGSGAAVAAGLVVGSLGSDTGGSVRIPAALCGIAGLKTTNGLVSRYGVVPNSFTFDTCGPMAWTVEDCAILLQAIAGHDPRDASSARRPVPDYRAALSGDIRGLRLGVLRHFWADNADAETAAAMEASLDVLSGLGAIVEETRVRPPQDYYDVKIVIAETELYATHEKELRTRPGDFGADFLSRAFPACLFRAVDYIQAQRQQRRILSEMRQVYDKCDALVTVGAAAPATRLDAHKMGESWEKPNVTTPFNVTGGPALVLCNGYSAAGLPLSLQIVGRPFDEATVLRIGDAYERATDWRQRRPNLTKGASQVPVTPAEAPTTAPDLDAETTDIVEARVARAGLTLDDGQRARLYAAAPHALAMGRRLRGPRPWEEAPANVFRFPRRL
jgi:aspartyl-tRNA(Asn)/glutamyl-tRNA(Gln) amidotransferase subunit A